MKKILTMCALALLLSGLSGCAFTSKYFCPDGDADVADDATRAHRALQKARERLAELGFVLETSQEVLDAYGSAALSKWAEEIDEVDHKRRQAWLVIESLVGVVDTLASLAPAPDSAAARGGGGRQSIELGGELLFIPQHPEEMKPSRVQ